MAFEAQFTPGASVEENLETAVFQALGGASVCWENIEKAGVFDSTKAKEIGDWLVKYIREEYARERGAIY